MQKCIIGYLVYIVYNSIICKLLTPMSSSGWAQKSPKLSFVFDGRKAHTSKE